MRRWEILLIVFGMLPSVSEAAVVINEVAWMGGVASANDEWIELHNTGTARSVEGWTLSDGMNLEIGLVGAIGADQYAVLERTDDASAPGTAFLIYTGSLPNTGATLTLRDSAGAVVDQVAGGEDWENVGGDNTTKETAQLTTGGWVTGTPTPGSTNVSVGTDSTSDNENTVVSESAISNESDPSVSLELPDHTLGITLQIPTQVYVNQAIDMEVVATGIGDLVESLHYSWNFGDATIDVGKNVEHTYLYPGTYVVVAKAHYARHSATIKKSITVLPVNFSITRNEAGDVQIHNDAPYDIDLSGYRLQGSEGLILPPDTWLLPNATLTIPVERLGAGSQLVALFDSEKTIVAHHGWQMEVAAPTAPPPTLATAPLLPSGQVLGEQMSESESPQQTEPTTTVTTVLSTSSALTANSNQATMPISVQYWPYLALIGLLSLGFLAILASRIKPESTV